MKNTDKGLEQLGRTVVSAIRDALTPSKQPSEETKQYPTSGAPKPIFVDEFHLYSAGRDDGIKEKLRVIDGIPNAAYLVNGSRVFVFDKLVGLVKERLAQQPDASISEVALELFQAAHVPPMEAVSEWRITPEPYELCDDPIGGIAVRHRPFNAQLPGTFASQEDARSALARLLLGEVIQGHGDFTYRGQPMTLIAPFPALDKLPQSPEIDQGLERVGYVYTALGSVTYEPGFDPISEELFSQLKEREETWQDLSARASAYAGTHAADLWQLAQTLRLEQLNDTEHQIPEWGREDAEELRKHYPELGMLSDASLYDWFDTYQVECCYLNGWTACRDDSFLFYLLGRSASNSVDRESATELGQWIAYALLRRGGSLDDALSFGRAALGYDDTLSKLAGHTAEAMRFLSKEREATDHRGAPIHTMADFMSIGRKFGVNSQAASQSLSDLENQPSAADRKDS